MSVFSLSLSHHYLILVYVLCVLSVIVIVCVDVCACVHICLVIVQLFIPTIALTFLSWHLIIH